MDDYGFTDSCIILPKMQDSNMKTVLVVQNTEWRCRFAVQTMSFVKRILRQRCHSTEIIHQYHIVKGY